MKLELTVLIAVEMPDDTPTAVWSKLILANTLQDFEFDLLPEHPARAVRQTYLIKAHSYETTMVERLED